MDFKIINPIPKEDLIYISYLLKENIISEDLKHIGSGASADVYKYKNYAIKLFDECDDDNSDGIILEKLQDIKIFPKLYFYNNEIMVTEYYHHVPAYDYFERNVDISYTHEDIFRMCYNKGYMPYDIHDENVVITNKDELKFIDVGNFRSIKVTSNFYKSLDKWSRLEMIELGKIIDHVKRPSIAI